MVQWLRLHASNAGGMGSILRWAGKFCMMHGMAKKKKKRDWMPDDKLNNLSCK